MAELKDIAGTNPQNQSVSSIAEKLSKSKKAYDRKKRRCQVCGKALKSNQWQYCGDKCRTEIIAQHQTHQTSKLEASKGFSAQGLTAKQKLRKTFQAVKLMDVKLIGNLFD